MEQQERMLVEVRKMVEAPSRALEAQAKAFDNFISMYLRQPGQAPKPQEASTDFPKTMTNFPANATPEEQLQWLWEHEFSPEA